MLVIRVLSSILIAQTQKLEFELKLKNSLKAQSLKLKMISNKVEFDK